MGWRLSAGFVLKVPRRFPPDLASVNAGRNGTSPRSAHQRTMAALDRNDCRLPALHRELDRNIVPRSVRVGADFLVRLAGESLELRLRERRVLDVQLHCDAESARVARPDRHAAGDGCALGVLLLLDRNKIECATEAGGVADRE